MNDKEIDDFEESHENTSSSNADEQGVTLSARPLEDIEN